MKMSLFSLVIWGLLTGNWLAAGLLCILIGSAWFNSYRANLSIKQFYTAGNYISAFFVAALLVLAMMEIKQRFIFVVLEWFPVFFMPLLVLQLYNVKNQLPTGMLLYSMRQRQPIMYLDFHSPYTFICLLSAGVMSDNRWLYFLACFVVMSVTLWSVRSKNSSVWFWLLLMICSYGVSFVAQQGLTQLYKNMEAASMQWLSDWHTDPFKSMTAIGDIGNLKLSNRIEFRVKADEPLLLLQASYDRHLGQSWVASQRVFREKPYYLGRTENNSIKQLEVFQSRKRATILALPAGTVEIKGLEGAKLEFSALGAVKLTEAPDFINYQLFYTGKQLGKTSPFDLQIPKPHLYWINRIKQQLKLDNQPSQIIATKITQFFQNNYYYSLFLGKESDANKALETFMLERKAGHCEYFAVASTLLLRSYGIPARLANGYSMQEYDEDSQHYIIRRRHSHAWSIAHIEGVWQAVDATPSQWLAMEDESVSLWEPIYDFFSSLYFQYKQWRYEQALAGNQDNSLILGLLTIGLLILMIRLYYSRRYLFKRRVNVNKTQDNYFSGLDSEIYLIEQTFLGTYKARESHEALMIWAKRLDNRELIQLVKLHDRYRFDHQSFTSTNRQQLKQGVLRWLKQFKSLK